MTLTQQMTVQNTNQASFFFENVPLLSAAMLVCCARDDHHELKMFWDPTAFDQFVNTFKLSSEQAALIYAPARNPTPTGEKPVPTESQLEETGAALIMELRGAMAASRRATQVPVTDSEKLKNFPVLEMLYQHFALGTTRLSATWEEDLVAELRAFRLFIAW